jgi:hypothetical protein
MSMSGELTERHPGLAFPEDPEAILWLFAQRKEDNLLHQSLRDTGIKDCDDLSDGTSIVEFRQAKQP